jgi:hypothetical protein
VFCLRREVWGQVFAEFAIDHFEPVANRPDRATEYDNLLYVCGACNTRKGNRLVPDPLIELLSSTVAVEPNGAIDVHTRNARRIARILQLDLPEMTEYRAMWIGVVQLAATYDIELYRRLMGYPAELPDLARLMPPLGNSRPEGIEQSCFRRRERGELAEVDLD